MGWAGILSGMDLTNEDKVGRILLEHMADALDEGDEALRETPLSVRFLIARDCAHQLRLVDLQDHFTTGPYAGLSMITKQLGEATKDADAKTFSKLSGLVLLARKIPVGVAPEADTKEAQAFREALASFIEDTHPFSFGK